MYHLFEFSDFYPNGGFNDYRNTFDSIEEAKTYLYSDTNNLQGRQAHIVYNLDKIVWAANFNDMVFPARWEELEEF